MLVLLPPDGRGRASAFGTAKWRAGRAGEADTLAADGVRGHGHAPEWFGEGVTYQIFPDRFRRVAMPDVSSMVGRRWLHELGRPAGVPSGGHGPDHQPRLLGGSLAGITEKLDYLAGLGVTTLYLNPIFEAASNHRYDTADYRAIDPLLGSKEDFRALCDGAHERGMRVILDGVFNHTGSNSRYFNAEGLLSAPWARPRAKAPLFPLVQLPPVAVGLRRLVGREDPARRQ